MANTLLDTKVASQLLDFGSRIGAGARADEQLEGAVAIHNMLQSHGVAYLADEVGMGKTYVALGALALFRHFNPGFRVLVLAPRGNIQSKWIKEQRNFVANNVRICDMRVKSLHGSPARPLVSCSNLHDLVHEVTADPNRDFFAKMTSFSFPITGKHAVNRERGEKIRDAFRSSVPWLRNEIFDLRSKEAFKDNFAKALCCVLPAFDLVIVDEAHNLKHGYGESVSSRNRLLALAMGHPSAEIDSKLFPGYTSRATRVLFLSATPVEETYQQLWNQLDVFGKAGPYKKLLDKKISDEERKAVASEFLIRRVTSVRIGTDELTKNEYRREWRRGGVASHDEPIRVEDPKQRMVVALVQKKVTELLGHERFNSSFQIGMLASFESFLETAKLKREDDETSNFDDSDQTENAMEKEGVDVNNINRLARSYRSKFHAELPHPKMDALVESLSQCWDTGEKALVFVRRVASVKELKRKLDDRYNEWLMNRLRAELPQRMQEPLESLFETFRQQRLAAGAKQLDSSADAPSDRGKDSDSGGLDTFFAWFFRGEGPANVISGANIQRRFIQRGTVLATFFADNYVADVLRCEPAVVETKLCELLGLTPTSLREVLQKAAGRFLSGAAKKQTRADRFDAVQAAAIELLKDKKCDFQEDARVAWHERFERQIHANPAAQASDIEGLLAVETFFTKLRHRPELRAALWPEPVDDCPTMRFRKREWRGSMFASVARLGHAFIDLYVLIAARLESLDQRSQQRGSDDDLPSNTDQVTEYLDLLEQQRMTDRKARGWRAFDELADVAANFDLIVDVNAPDIRDQHVDDAARDFGVLLGRQQPVGGMSGKVNETLVRQFRMPGYPLVLFSTDLLQEGEDLHTFCSSIHHYGISWTPSSMEQRIGRIDRVRSHSDRRLSDLQVDRLGGDEKLQVFFPHLEDTVEVFQVHRVLDRMNVFLRLMHEGLTVAKTEQRTINTSDEFAKSRKPPEQIRGRLKTAFPVQKTHLIGTRETLAATNRIQTQIHEQFKEFASHELSGLAIQWEPVVAAGVLMGTAKLKQRIQPFTLVLDSIDHFPCVRCISPVGRVDPGCEMEAVLQAASISPMKIGAIVSKDDRSYDLTTEGEVLLGGDDSVNRKRVADLISRVVHDADTLELELLPGRDESLDKFREELRKEVSHDD
ncbi:ATP-dependent helicase HepA [Rubripirellula lacrimiformis]|uniref:ATP-dependent helicase HepA n=2 Tax=Rubripirellula lacrimiformis TaxID=1930273 RepID=A0A517NAS3_9BACT|nr:ATP-dependent helicase HepA [Rubripirellula lacrimiformis]